MQIMTRVAGRSRLALVRLLVLPVMVLSMAVAACSTPSPVESYPDITFTHRPQLRFDVSRVDVDDRYQPTMAAPHVDHLAPAQPALTLKRWAADRLVAAGSQGRLVMRIEDASIVEAALPVQSGVKGMFKDEQAKRFNLRIKVSVEAETGNRRLTALAEVEVTQSRTISEGASLRERDRALFEMTEQAMKVFDEEMERQIRQHLAAVLL